MKHDVKALDMGQLDHMWDYLKMGGSLKPNVEELKHFLDLLRQAMIQKTGGQKPHAKPGDVDLQHDLGTIVNVIVIETMALYLNGDLDKLSVPTVKGGE